MKETRPYVSWEQIGGFMEDAFVAYGVPREDAKICADVLMESDRQGIESHGCNRFKPIYIDRIVDGIQNPVTRIDVLKETATTAVLDANDGMGMVASHRAMEMAIIEKAGTYGLAAAAIRNSLSLRHSRVLGRHGCECRHDRHHGHKRPSLHRSHFRR